MWKPHLAALLLAACLAAAAEADSEAAALQKDIISDVSQLAAFAPKTVPNLLEAALASDFKPMPTGTMVTRKFDSVDELKQTGPVKQVKGRLMGGPFTMAQAVRAAGMAVIRRIFPRSAGAAEDEDDAGGGDQSNKPGNA
jgi:hypothetical protein